MQISTLQFAGLSLSAVWMPEVPQLLVAIDQHLEAGRFREAEEGCRDLLRRQPQQPDAWHLLGMTALATARLALAEECVREAIRLRPQSASYHTTLGCLREKQGRVEEAIASLSTAISIDPTLWIPHHNLAQVLLLHGDFPRGLAEYEWRPSTVQLPIPKWDGRPMTSGVLLLLAEQGLGDVFQFIRYVRLIRERVGELLLVCHPAQTRLLRHSLPECLVETEGMRHADAWLFLLSLPRLCGTTLETIPNEGPYLRAEPELVQKWRPRLAGDAQLKVGLAWAGSKRKKNDRERSVALAQLAPLLAVRGVTFYSLQVGEESGQARETPVIDVTPELTDFAETAALLECLDLVISVDTAVAHLAGALARPVWVMLAFAPDWRWLRERTDSPWYPTMTLFRQTESGAWEGVVAQVAEALAELARGRKGSERAGS